MLSTDDIFARARTIYERVDPRRRQQVDSQTLSVLASWSRAFAPGNPEALTRRLAWDDLTPELIAAALTADPDPDAPAWTVWIDRIAAAARTLRSDLAPSAAFADVPFAEIWTAVLRAAGPSALPALDRQLLRELSALGELAIDAAFTQYLDVRGLDRRTQAPDSTDAYRAFVLSMLGLGLQPLWNAYPVLARQVAIAAGGWSVSSAELFERFARDRGRIAETLNGGADPGDIADIEPGLSDAHDGRRRVSILHFPSGLRIVYKPRDVQIEEAFGALAAWLAARGFNHAIPVSRVVAGRGYGWVERAAHGSFDSETDVRRYFRQAGALIFLTHLLGSKDLHMENLVATREGPVVIDLELLLQPELKPATESEADRSCLRTGLLSLVEFGPGDEVFDVGGLRGDGRVPLATAIRRWRNLGTDAIAYADEMVAHADVKNTVVLNGQSQRPETYRTEILDGFASAYRFALANRAALPIDVFRSAMVRVIARPTNQYALLTTVQSAPRYQKDGVASSILADVLIRPLAAATERPREWPLIVEERRAIEAIDVPRFVVPADGRTLMTSFPGERAILPDYFARSPLESVRERLAALSSEDCESQRLALDRALRDSVGSRFATPFESGEPGGSGEFDDFAAAAEWIGRELRQRAIERGDAIVWSPEDPARASSHHLYLGSVGPAVFLSALAATTGAARWQRMARAAAVPAIAWAESGVVDRDAPIGACSGLGSIVYGLTLTGTLVGNQRAIAAARRVAASIDAGRIANDRSFDIVDGTAGALLSVLALYDVTRDAALVATAKACGDHLLASHLDAASAWTWPPASQGDSRRLVGFAHGAAGIAFALTRLADATGVETYREGASQALAFVARNFSSVDATWPVAEADASDISTTIIRMNAWCHGAPGIALAAVRLAGHAARSGSAVILGQARSALERLPEWGPNQADHVCCGHLGRVDVLVTAGPALGVEDAVSRAQSIARRVLSRARTRQHFRLSTPGFEYRVFDPGFFKGLSGIGYTLLRLASPDRLPSVPSFGAPRT